jgi:hypothetical protein
MNRVELYNFLNSDGDKIKYGSSVKVDLLIKHIVKLWEQKVFKIKEDITKTNDFYSFGRRIGFNVKVEGCRNYTGKELVALLKNDK